jgi:NMD protein affecting ribosome stability and mRNA decay
MESKGQYMCETCFDELTNHVVDVRGFEEAVCDTCLGPDYKEPRVIHWWEWGGYADIDERRLRYEQELEAEEEIRDLARIAARYREVLSPTP